MPIKHAAFKALRQTKKRTVKNRAIKDKIKKTRKQILKLWAEKKSDEAKKLLPVFAKIADKAAKVNVIAKNKASRLKSRLAAQMKKMV